MDELALGRSMNDEKGNMGQKILRYSPAFAGTPAWQ